MHSAEAAAACSTLDRLLCSLAHTVLLCAGCRQGVPPSLLHLLSPAHFAQPLPSTTFSLPPTGIRALHLPGKPRLALIGPPVTAASAPAVLGLQAVVPLNSAVWVQVQQEEVLLRGQDSVKRVGTAHVRGSGKEPKAGTGASIDWEALSASCSSPPGAPSNCACSKRRAAHRVVSNGRQGERWEGVQALPGDPLQRRQAGQRERGQQSLARPQPKGRPTRACCRAPLGRTWQVKRRGPGWARRWGCAAPAARTLWKCPVSSSFTLLCRSSTARRSGGAPGRSTSPSTEVASGKWVWRGGVGRGVGGGAHNGAAAARCPACCWSGRRQRLRRCSSKPHARLPMLPCTKASAAVCKHRLQGNSNASLRAAHWAASSGRRPWQRTRISEGLPSASCLSSHRSWSSPYDDSLHGGPCMLLLGFRSRCKYQAGGRLRRRPCHAHRPGLSLGYSAAQLA